MSGTISRLEIRIGMRTLTFTVKDARELYVTLKNIFEPEKGDDVVQLFKQKGE